MAPWSRGQDASLSRWNQGFDSPRSHLKSPRNGTFFRARKLRGNQKEQFRILTVEDKIADRIKNNILPSTLELFDIVTDAIDGISVTNIIVSSGLEKPYYVKNKGMSPNGCFMRLGTSTQPLPTTLIDELYSKRIHTTLRNIPAPRQDLTFAQLKIYYQERGLELNSRFAQSLELLTPDGQYNYIAYLLADENGVSIKVLLDEATASLDVENETLIQTALSRLIADKTVLVIAHRMRTVAGADKIVVLSDGTVAEEGSPKELAEKNGVYANMVKLQAENQSWKLE